MTTETRPAEPVAGEIRTDLGIREYHAGPGISSSQIAGWFDTCPAYWLQDQEASREPSEAMIFGDLVHAITLEPERFQECFATEPLDVLGEPLNKRKPAHREALKDWREALGCDVRVVSQQDLEDAVRLANAMNASPFFKDLLGPDPMIEASAFWEDEKTGLLCKVRPDWFSGLIGDIKTTRDSGAPGFSKQVSALHYDTKAAFYLHGIEQVTGERPMGFVWVAINRERAIPEFYALDEQRLALGNHAWRTALDGLALCMNSDIWPDYTGEQVRELPLEPWRVRELERLEGSEVAS